MELIKGNLLFFLTITGIVAFLFCYSSLYNGPFRMQFQFYRKKNMQYECKIAGPLILGISILCMVLYKVLCILFHYTGTSLLSLSYPLLALLACYLLLSTTTLCNGVVTLIAALSALLLLPILLAILILVFRIQFDQYYGYFSVLLAIFNLILIPNWLHTWKKGDLS